jgi:hypothetical protein
VDGCLAGAHACHLLCTKHVIASSALSAEVRPVDMPQTVSVSYLLPFPEFIEAYMAPRGSRSCVPCYLTKVSMAWEEALESVM